jgi:tRNA (adenine22-N1)-methyltransferase
MQLSQRMQAVADLVTKGSRLADVGTDHGYVPIYLVQQGIVPKAIAMDVRKGPLAHADANIEKYGLSGRIETRLSDGLHALNKNEADSVVIAGMGGLLMVRILEEGLRVLETVRECILQPQSDVDSVRRFLHEHGFCITKENMVIDGGKYYVMMRVVHGKDCAYDAVDDLYGKLLMEAQHPVLKACLEKEAAVMVQIMQNLEKQTSEKSESRLTEMKIAYQRLSEAIKRVSQ